MKKVFLLFVSIAMIGFTACSSDDDNDNKGSDPIIGTWNLYSINGKELSECERKSSIVFSKETVLIKAYSNDENKGCTLEASLTGTWKNEGEGNYTITNNEQEKTTNFITFSDKNRTMSYTEEGNKFVWKRK